ncbi:MAG: hypothetical protein IE886_07120 [Campylobacterales bacterium]|nr:hypothetical protein [Campylobacterales bacterium]
MKPILLIAALPAALLFTVPAPKATDNLTNYLSFRSEGKPSPECRPDMEKLIADTAAAHLEVRIEAR